MTTETWKDVPRFEGRYQVSDWGCVRSADRYVRTVAKNGTETERRVKGQILAPQKHTAGYLAVGLGGRTWLIGAIVLTAFVGPRPSKHQHAHNDGNRRNNCLANLRWATAAANSADRITHGTSGKGEKNSRAKLTAAKVKAIREDSRSQQAIAKRFGIRQSTVSKIKLRTRWGHV